MSPQKITEDEKTEGEKMYDNKDYFSLEEIERNGRSCRYEVCVAGGRIGLQVVTFRTDSCYQVEIGLGVKSPLYTGGTWVTKTKIAYWDGAGADRQPEEKEQVQDHLNQISWHMGSVWNVRDVESSVFDFILSDYGSVSISIAQLKAVRLQMMMAKQLQLQQAFLQDFIAGDAI